MAKRIGQVAICVTCGEREPKYGNGMCRKCWAADYYEKNKDRIRQAERERRRRQPPEKRRELNARHRERRSDWRLERYYNLTREQYDEMLATQGGACAICRKACSSGKALAVDHDHACCPGKESCGKCVRGLLCYRCNSSLGFVDEDVEKLKAMMQYLIEKLDKKGDR